MRIAAALILIACVAACGGDDCPELDVKAAEWIPPLGASDECAELASALNGEIDLNDDSGGGDDCGELEQHEGEQCSVSVRAECDGVALALECEATDAGADCLGVVRSAELECAYRVLLR
jgi:hypothetical protein